MTSQLDKQEVRVTDIQMPFGSMVVFMVKWAIASIPALIILVVLGAVLWAFVAALLLSVVNPFRSPLSGAGSAGSGVTSSVGGSTSTSTSKLTADKTAYLDKVLVSEVSVGKSILDEAGVFGEVKNSGDRTLKEVEITIYCLGSDGKPVFEKTYRPVLVSGLTLGDNQPLKPGYSRQFGVRMQDAPSDWTKKVEVRVTNIEFQ